MTDQQLCLAIGLPVLVCLFGFTATILVAFWQTKDLKEDIRSVVTKIDLLTGKVNDIDTRLAVIEDREKDRRR